MNVSPRPHNTVLTRRCRRAKFLAVVCRAVLLYGALASIALPTAPASAQPKGTAWAVVVGLNYNWSPGNTLHFTISDAQRFQECLQTCLHVPSEHFILLTDEEDKPAKSRATKANIMQAIKEMAAKAQPNDTFWFYFSGHGQFLPASDSSFLIPADIKTLTSDTGVSVHVLRDTLKSCRARTKILALDACESGSSKRWQDVPNNAPASRIFPPLPPGMFTLAAARPDLFAYETAQSPISGGIFTYYLCCGLAGEGTDSSHPVTLKTLERYVTAKVKTECENLGRRPLQEPVFLAQEGESAASLPNITVSQHNDHILAQLKPTQTGQVTKIAERSQFDPGAILVTTAVVETEGRDGIVKAEDTALQSTAQTTLEHAIGEKQVNLYSYKIAPEQLRAMQDPKRTAAGLAEARRLSARLLLQIRVTVTVSPSEDEDIIRAGGASIVRVTLHAEVTDVNNTTRAAVDIEEDRFPSGKSNSAVRAEEERQIRKAVEELVEKKEFIDALPKVRQ